MPPSSASSPNQPSRLSTVRDPTPAQIEAVDALVASDPGPVAPLSEQSLLTLHRGRHDDDDEDTCHLLLYADTAPRALVGYAQIIGEDGGHAAELLVAPDRRRRGAGTLLLRAVLDLAPDVRVWAHGNSAAAQALAGAVGMAAVRDLWQMRRELGEHAAELPGVDLPPGFVARSFEPGRDEQAWLKVNSRAFASHAEQGRMTRGDLDARMAEAWFDPTGFILVEDQTEARRTRDHGARSVTDAPLAAFHWTKVEGDEGSGEVYVVGVDPAYQGRGLGTAVTVLGLKHLTALGLREATLYVDGDNSAAVATYTRLGFERSTVDVMYTVADLPSPPTVRLVVGP